MRTKLLLLYLLFFSVPCAFSQEGIKTITVKKKFSEADLFPRIANKLTGTISFKEIESDPVLKTNSNLVIIKFQLSLRVGSGEQIYYASSSNLTPEMLSKLANLKEGEPILFTNIVAQDELKRSVKLQPLMLELR